jgi:hypothetical protein
MRKLLTALILGAALMVFFGNALAGEKAYVPKDNEELYGTWVNMDYKTADPPQKLTYKSDGTIYSSIYAESRMLLWKTKFQITAKWKDSEGNIWYKGHWVVVDTGEEGYSLYKISNSGKTCEYIFDLNECPTKVDTEHRNYRIYYRFIPTVEAAESFESTACASGTSTMVHNSKELMVLGFEFKGIVRSNTNSEIFNNVSEMCVGLFCKKGDDITQRGYCKYMYPNGDITIMEWDGKADDGNWNLLLGTGKWEGIKASGTWSILQRAKPIAPGTVQNCRTIKGTYELPK